MRKFSQYATMLILFLALAVFLLTPIFLVVKEGLNLNFVTEVFRNKIYVEGLFNSLKIAVSTTFLTLIIALPLALIFNRYDFKGKNITAFLMLLPMILPPFVGALGFQQIFGHFGVINTIINAGGGSRIDFLSGSGKFLMVILIEALHLYPILYLNLVASLNGIDPSLNDAACNLGAGKIRRFFTITLPLLKSGLFAGSSIILIWSFTELGTPLMFGYNRTTPVQIFNGINEIESNPLPYTLVALMLLVSAILYTLAKFALKSHESSIVKGTINTQPQQIKTPLFKYLPITLFLLLAAVSILPHIALTFCAFTREWYMTVLPQGFTWWNFDEALSNPIVLPSIINSLKYSLLATFFAVLIGFSGAFINNKWRLKGGFLLDLLCMLPLAVPGIVIAFGYIAMSAKINWAADIFNPSGNPLLLLSVAYAIRRIPYVIRSAEAGLQQLPDDLESASRNLGGSAWITLRKITLPLILANLAIGGLFAFSFSMLEVSDSLILAQKSSFYPITKALFELSQFLGEGPAIACAFGVWTMAFLAATFFAAIMLSGKKISNVFKF